jgi:hypothetical protein
MAGLLKGLPGLVGWAGQLLLLYGQGRKYRDQPQEWRLLHGCLPGEAADRGADAGEPRRVGKREEEEQGWLTGRHEWDTGMPWPALTEAPGAAPALLRTLARTRLQPAWRWPAR